MLPTFWYINHEKIKGKECINVSINFISIYRHNDLAWQFYKNENNSVYNVDLKDNLLEVWAGKVTHTDIPRIRKGKLKAQVISL